MEELHYCLGGDAVGVEPARENAADLMTPAQTPDLIIRERQGLMKHIFPTSRGQRGGL